jgi:hypothetical protein
LRKRIGVFFDVVHWRVTKTGLSQLQSGFS